MQNADKKVLVRSKFVNVMKAMHNNPVTGGHFARLVQCASKVNPKMSSDAPPLHPVSVPSKVWSLVGIDLVGRLPTTKLGNKYIVAITDHFSKWTEELEYQTKGPSLLPIFYLA